MTPRAFTSPGFSTSLLLAALFAAWMGPAHAQSLPGEGNSCLPDLGNGKTCTANDLRLQAQVVSAPLSCELGDTISVTFRTSVGSTAASRAAGERYSLGFFIGENGAAAIDPGAGETCTVSYLTPNTGSINLTSGVGPYRELSPSADQCGDIQDADTTFHDITSSQILCRDNDGDGRVDISAAVTWESNKSRTCASPPTVADFVPDQSSKCLSSLNFGLDIPVETTPPEITVSKTAIPDVIEAPGATVTYEVIVTNASGPFDTVVLSSALDDKFGDITALPGNCDTLLDSAGIAPGSDRRCRFEAAVFGNPGDTHTNTVTIAGADEEGSSASASDSAVVSIIAGAPPPASMTVVKGVAPASLPEPGGEVDYTLQITNTGEDTLTVTALSDSLLGGSANGVGNCTLPQTIPSGAAYGCSYPFTITGEAGDMVVNTVTATAQPSAAPGTILVDTDSAEVEILDVPGLIAVSKIPVPREIPDPGAGNSTPIAYQLTVFNLSQTDAVTINSLSDVQQEGTNPPSAPVDVLSLPAVPGRPACSLPQTIPTGFGRVYACWFQRSISGDNVDEGDVVSNTVRAAGVDDDGEPVEASGGGNVTICLLYTSDAADEYQRV